MQKNEKAVDLIPAAGYFRMSSDDQTTSIKQQEKEVAELETRGGYKIVERYYEEGRSGSKNQDLRTEFNRMLLDAAVGKFKAILCYDSSRFARLDSIDGAIAKQMLRKHGVYLVTVKEGKFDWTTFEGRLQDVILSESNHKYSRDLSKESIRGRLDRLNDRLWPNGAVPYGYDRLYTSSQHRQLIKRSESFRKARNWTLTLVKNEEEAPVVTELFETFATEDTSMRHLAGELSKRGIPTPSGKGTWSKTAVKSILTNRAYLGYGRIGLGRWRQKEAFNRAKPTEVAGVCPALVDEETFAVVQAKLEELKVTGRRPQRFRSSVLSGAIVCGHCGYRMQKKSRKNGVTYFTCSSALHRPGAGCHQWRVHEEELLPHIVKLLTDAYQRDILQKLHVEAPLTLHDGDLPCLQKTHAELKARIEKGSERYLTAPDAIKDSLSQSLQRWQAEARELEAKIGEIQLATSDWREALESWIEQIGKDLRLLAEATGPSETTVKPAQVPKWVLAAARKRFHPRTVFRCNMVWDDGGTVDFDKGPLYEITPDREPWIIETTGDYHSSIVTNDARLREFLRKTHAKVTLFWKKRGKRYFELDRGKLEADFGEHLLAVRNASVVGPVPKEINEHLLAERSNMRSRAHNPCMH